jgi:hypothetical protein
MEQLPNSGSPPKICFIIPHQLPQPTTLETAFSNSPPASPTCEGLKPMLVLAAANSPTCHVRQADANSLN